MSSQNKLDSVIAKASRLVSPSEREKQKLDSIAKDIASKLERALTGSSNKPEVKLGGSYAKGTWLPKSCDLDFFLLYPTDYPREKLESEALDLGREAVKGYQINMRFAEHPYVEAFVGEARINIVPCYKVEKGKWQSAADRSPYHAEFVGRNFDEKLRLETRLLKKFVRNVAVYGAEVKTQGFSGYVCEVLTKIFGDFVSVLKHLSSFQRGEILSLEPYDVDLAKSFPSAIVILDPVDSTRNLGTAISTRNLSKVILQSRRFLSKPSISFFMERRNHKVSRPRSDLLKRTLVIRFETKQRSLDILWGQLYKSLDSLSSKIESWGFEVLRSRASSNEKSESAFIFLLLEPMISTFQARIGPDVFRREDFSKYIAKNRTKAIISWLDSEGKANSLFAKKKSSNDVFREIRRVLLDRKQLSNLGLSKAIQDEIRSFWLETGVQVLRRSERGKEWLQRDIRWITTTEEDLGNATD